MKFSINELDAKLFQLESGLIAADHPYIYLQRMHIKLTESVLNEMKELKMALLKMNTNLNGD
jgi:hypothetical protein